MTRRALPVRLAGVSRRRTPTVSPSLSHRLDVLALALTALIVLTGAAVRLTGSGLGCSNWPECSAGHLTPALQFHGLVEFGNRLVTVVLTDRRRRCLLGLGLPVPRAGATSSGSAADWSRACWLRRSSVASSCYTKLNPYVVMVHFFATMLLLVDAVVLVHRSTRDYSPGSAHLLIPRPLIRLYYGLLTVLALVIAAGTATTGAGPHAGESSGQQVAKRIPVALRDMAELHSSLALLLIGVTIGLVVAVHVGDVPERVRRAARILMAVMVAQGAVGYIQYFTHLPALLVEVHILGATALVIGAVQTFLACTYHAPEAVPAPLPVERPTPGVPIGAH